MPCVRFPVQGLVETVGIAVMLALVAGADVAVVGTGRGGTVVGTGTVGAVVGAAGGSTFVGVGAGAGTGAGAGPGAAAGGAGCGRAAVTWCATRRPAAKLGT